MSENLFWGLIAISVLALCLVYSLLRSYLQLRGKLKRREMLSKERLAAIAKELSLPGEDPTEVRWGESLLLRFAGCPGLKVVSFIGAMAFFSGVGVWAGLGFLPSCYVLHDFWSLGLVGVALGIGLLIYALSSTALTRKVIAERKLS